MVSGGGGSGGWVGSSALIVASSISAAWELTPEPISVTECGAGERCAQLTDFHKWDEPPSTSEGTSSRSCDPW